MGVYTGVTKSRQKINHVESDTVTFNSFTVDNLPDASDWPNTVVFVSNGAAGDPVLAFSNGTNWLRCDTLATVAASGA